MHARGEYGPQFLYLTTPESTPFEVRIKKADGTVLSVLNISNSSPQRFSIGSSNDTYVLVPENDLHQALTDKGLILEAEKKYRPQKCCIL